MILSYILQFVPMFTLIPRFIMSIREMYAREVHGSGVGMDTGFGLSTSGRDASGTAIMFADVGQLENVEEMSMKAWTVQAA